MPIYKMQGKKDGKQKYRVMVNYTDNNGNYHKKTKTAYGLDEAKECERNLASEVSQTAPDSKMTVQQLYDDYIAVKKHEVRITSLEKTKSILNREIIPVFGETKIDKLNIPTLQKWKNSVAEKKLSVKTKNNIYTEFRAMLNYAVKMEYISKNPLNSIGNFKNPEFETAEEKLHYYTAEQFKKYIAAAKSHIDTISDYGYYVFFNIAFYTGMRKGEINALKWSDIDGDYIHVRRSVAQKVKGSSIIETPPKNKSSYRTLQIPTPLASILKEYKSKCQAMRNFTDDYRVCGGITCLSDTMISNKNIQYADEAGLPRIRIHDFRHSHASLLANEGINIQEIARRLGHSKIETTWNTYSHLYPREEERAVNVLNNIVV